MKLGQTVFSEKRGKGTITNVITQSTGYLEIDFNGVGRKEMAYNLTNGEGNPLKSKPAKRKPRELSPLLKAKNKFLWINNQTYGVRVGDSYVLVEGYFATLQLHENANNFIKDVCKNAITYMKISDSQASCLAKFAIENNITLK